MGRAARERKDRRVKSTEEWRYTDSEGLKERVLMSERVLAAGLVLAGEVKRPSIEIIHLEE